MNPALVRNVTLLGTGSAYADAKRNHVSLLVKNSNGHLLFDCGGAPSQALLKYGSKPEEIEALVVSHEHVDHLAGLPSLVHTKWLRSKGQANLDLFGYPRTLDVSKDLLRAFNLLEGKSGLSVRFFDLDRSASHNELHSRWAVDLFPTRHGRMNSFGMLMTGPQKKFVYTSDCVLDRDVFEIIRNSDADTVVVDCGAGLLTNNDHSGLDLVEKFFGCDPRINLVHIRDAHSHLLKGKVQSKGLNYVFPDDGAKFDL